MAAKEKIYEVLKEERKQLIDSEINDKLARKTKEIRKIASLRTAVLDCMVNTDYDSASEILTVYVEQNSEFLEFQMRVEPYIKHCQNLVRSIEMKRNFPKITALPTIKQQELMDKVIEDFNELRLYLSRIEVMKTEVLFKDVLSVRLILKTAILCSFIVLIVTSVTSIGWHGVDFVTSMVEEWSNSLANFFID